MRHVAQPNDPPAPPTCAPSVPEKVIGPVTPSELVPTFPSSAGVAAFDVQYERNPEVSLVEVETVPDPPAPPVAEIVIGEEPMIVKGVQEAEPLQEAVVVATEERAFVPLPYMSWLEVNVPTPVPPAGTERGAKAAFA